MPEMSIDALNQGDKYRAFRNFMFNELGVTKADIRQWVIEAVQQQAANRNTEDMIATKVEQAVEREVRQSVKRALNINTSTGRSAVITAALVDTLANRVNVKIEVKE